MGQLEVFFEVPRWIEYGLATGEFQRVGGVIVESGSRHVVAWLPFVRWATCALLWIVFVAA